MRGDDEDAQSDVDDFRMASRINFRDYPSTALVVVGAVSSGLAWMLYKWLGRKGSKRDGASKQEAARSRAARTETSVTLGPQEGRKAHPE